MTATGVLGDSGADWAGFELLGGHGFEALQRTGDRIEQCLSSRQVCFGVDKIQISDIRVQRALSLGIDSRDLMPPFLPVGRGEERRQSEMVRMLYPGYLYAMHPLMVEHVRPVEGRRTTWGTLDHLGPGVVLGVFLQTFDYQPGKITAEEQLRRLGEYLEECGRYPTTLFIERVLSGWSSATEGRIGVLERRLNGPDTTHNMRAVLKAAIAALENELVECVRREQDSGVWERLQTSIIEFGKLVFHWPEILRAVQEMTSDRRLALVERV
jgi:hypothetical protein